jgi:pilin isopeptide linkage protein
VIPEGASNSYTVSFVNIYDSTDTAASFGGTKELTGRNLNEGEFTFALYATGDSFTVAEGMVPKQTVSNDAEGDFNFTAISYSKVGTYRYVVKENTSAKLGGVTYDESVFHVIVTVTDENGVLSASTVITDELGATAEIKFQNSYKAAATSVILTGTKTLTGADLTADMFQFHLYKADANYNIQGAALAGATNDASGRFTFESITCSAPGTFYYVVTEDDSAAVKGMTYDDTAYGIKVSVWDDGIGNLKASFTITVVGGDTVEAIIFENSYTKPVEPTDPTDPSDPPIPRTRLILPSLYSG